MSDPLRLGVTAIEQLAEQPGSPPLGLWAAVASAGRPDAARVVQLADRLEVVKSRRLASTSAYTDHLRPTVAGVLDGFRLQRKRPGMARGVDAAPDRLIGTNHWGGSGGDSPVDIPNVADTCNLADRRTPVQAPIVDACCQRLINSGAQPPTWPINAVMDQHRRTPSLRATARYRHRAPEQCRA